MFNMHTELIEVIEATPEMIREWNAEERDRSAREYAKQSDADRASWYREAIADIDSAIKLDRQVEHLINVALKG